jgi:glycosyltransferase involved in cell wall biosynthesis
MTRPEKNVAVVIPTMGRPTLEVALKSVRKQKVLPKEIIVVDDSVMQNLVIKESENVDLYKTGGNRGSSFARNLGMSKTKSNVIAFLDDDDCWEEDHLKFALDFMEEMDADAVYMSAKVGKRIRPEKTISGDLDPLSEIYNKKKLWKSQYFLPTPTLVIKRNVMEHIQFNELLRDREDLWFAHKIYEFGFKLRQSNIPTVIVYENFLRKINRSNLNEDLKWAKRLYTVNRHAAKNFLIKVSLRNLLLKGDLFGVVKLLFNVRSIRKALL